MSWNRFIDWLASWFNWNSKQFLSIEAGILELKQLGEQIMATVQEVTNDYNAIKKILTDKLAADADRQKALQDQIDALVASGVDTTALQALKDEMDADLATFQPPAPTP
jgi:hypothetical protein